MNTDRIKYIFGFVSILCFGYVLDVNAQTKNKNLPIPLDTTYTVASTYKNLRKTYPDITPVYPFSLKEVIEKRDVVYLKLLNTPFGTRDLHVDVFMPAGKNKVYPALLLIHGGGWRSGNKSLNTPMAQQLAARGFVVVSLEYRLSLEAPYPAAVYDAKAAIRWMRANAKRYHIDDKKIAVGGSSAGGQMASLVGTTNGQKKFEGTEGSMKFSSDVQAVIDLDGLLDFTDKETLELKRNDKSADVAWLESTYETNPARWKEASALHSVSASAPPFLFVNSSQSRFHAGCKNMVEKLNGFGIYNEVKDLEGAPHSYWLFNPWFEPTVEYMAGFLNKVFNENRK
ncbi:MAG TPA: alpha/beta hydrolase [Cyclobacteriaceae bacterium]|nr:alpha/beta hydrolase [Cyclobacteriaceae bacterium]